MRIPKVRLLSPGRALSMGLGECLWARTSLGMYFLTTRSPKWFKSSGTSNVPIERPQEKEGTPPMWSKCQCVITLGLQGWLALPGDCNQLSIHTVVIYHIYIYIYVCVCV